MTARDDTVTPGIVHQREQPHRAWIDRMKAMAEARNHLAVRRGEFRECGVERLIERLRCSLREGVFV